MGDRSGRRGGARPREVDAWIDRMNGTQLELDGTIYHIHDALTHRDFHSRSYLAIAESTGDRFLLRAFKKWSSSVRRLAEAVPKLHESVGVVPYTFVGPGRSQSRNRYEVICAVRPFEVHTYFDKRRRENLPPEGTLAAIHELAVGLKSLHDVGLAHGDIRPSNVLYVSGRENAGFIDYSLGLPFPAGVRRDVIARFAAPEMFLDAAGPPAITSASDVYSFGKLTRLFVGLSTDLTAQQRSKVEWLTAECLHIDPARRPEIELVRDTLRDLKASELPRLVERRFADLAGPALADMDARMPGILESASSPVVRSVNAAIRDLALEADSPRSFRLTDYATPQIVHLIGTMAFANPHMATKRFPGGSKGAILIGAMQEPELSLEVHGRDDLRDTIQAELAPPPAEEQAQLRARYAFLPELVLSRLIGSDREAVEESVARRLAVASEAQAALLDYDAFIPSEGVAALMSRSCPGITTDEVRVLRDFGYLLSVQHNQRNVYPLFQFNQQRGVPYSAIKTVNDRLHTSPASAWAILSWWFSADRYLDGGIPAELLRVSRDERSIAEALTQLSAA